MDHNLGPISENKRNLQEFDGVINEEGVFVGTFGFEAKGENRTMFLASFNSDLGRGAGVDRGLRSEGGVQRPIKGMPSFRRNPSEQELVFGGGGRRPVFGQKIGGPSGKREQGGCFLVGGECFVVLLY